MRNRLGLLRTLARGRTGAANDNSLSSRTRSGGRLGATTGSI